MKRWNTISSALNTPAGLAAFTVFVGAFLGLLAWFKLVDVYHTQFSTSGALVLAYNFFRVLFIFYLFWMVYSAGDLLLRAVLRRPLDELNLADDVALKFFAGTGVWHVALILLGYLRLYTTAVAIGIALPVVVVSFFEFWLFMQRARSEWRGRNRADSLHFAIAERALLGLAAVAALLLLAAKGLYPSGGHDYFLHYFSYYQSVIDHGGLWPNEVWYHYYYSKGAGLYFLGFLLADPLAPQLVTFCFIAVAGCVVYRFIQRFSASAVWPWVGVILFFGLYIYTPGRGEFLLNGGWGDFEKLHELNAALVAAILWMAVEALSRRGRAALPWMIGAASAITSAIIINVTISVYLGAVVCLLTLWFLIRRGRERAAICFGLACVSGAVLGATLIINYITTGLPNDQPLLYFWPLANLEKLYRWGALPLVMIIYQGTKAIDSRGAPLFSVDFVWQLLHFLRAYLLYPLFGGGFLLLLTAAAVRRWSLRRQLALIAEAPAVLVLLGALIAFGIFAIVGRGQNISFFRYSSFVVPILVVCGVGLCAVSLDHLVRSEKARMWSAAAPLFVVAAVAAASIRSFDGGRFRLHLPNTWRFAVGVFSIDKAYTTQIEAGRYPWGGIYPGARGAYHVVGPHTPIWSFHPASYCMMPNCNILTFPAFTMGPDWDRVMFGTPAEAKQALQDAGINYFLFSRTMGALDPLMTSPLFAPDNIARNFGIRWTDGTTALLTWLGPGLAPFDESWLESYRQAAKGASSVDDLKGIFARLRATPHPWRSFKLPW